MCNRNDILNILKLFKIYSKHKESEINYTEGVKFWPKFVMIDVENEDSYIMLQDLSNDSKNITVVVLPDKNYYFEYDSNNDDFNLLYDDLHYDTLNLIISSIKYRIVDSCL